MVVFIISMITVFTCTSSSHEHLSLEMNVFSTLYIFTQLGCLHNDSCMRLRTTEHYSKRRCGFTFKPAMRAACRF